MKQYLQKLIGIYEFHGKFYLFVHGLESALVAALVTYPSIPMTKASLLTAASFFGKIVYSYAKNWVIQNYK